MNFKLIAASFALTLFAGGVQAQTLVATRNIVVNALDRSINLTSDVTSRISDMKVVGEARDEAAGFVASGGELRGARLEAALGRLRDAFPEAQQVSDLALAEAILAQ